MGFIQLKAMKQNAEQLNVNVMFDEGSKATLIREGFTQRLSVSG